MAAGDIAAAAGYTINAGTQNANQIHLFINSTLDYLALKTGNAGAPIPIANGGSGATTAAGARTAFGALASADVVVSDGSVAIANKVPRYSAAGRMIVGYPSGANDVANKAYVDATASASGKVSKTGDTMTGDLFLPNSTAATSGYTAAYINGDGRVCRGASSFRWKKDITRGPQLPDVFAVPGASYKMRQDPLEAVRYGYIAEDLAANPATEPFVVYGEDGKPFSFDMTSLMFAQILALEARVKELEAR